MKTLLDNFWPAAVLVVFISMFCYAAVKSHQTPTTTRPLVVLCNCTCTTAGACPCQCSFKPEVPYSGEAK